MPPKGRRGEAVVATMKNRPGRSMAKSGFAPAMHPKPAHGVLGDTAAHDAEEPVQDIFAKTKLCKFYQHNACTKGSSCAFAHSKTELRPLPDLHCTKLCKRLMNNGVCDDPICTYAHRRHELRGPGKDFRREEFPKAAGSEIKNGGETKSVASDKAQKSNSVQMAVVAPVPPRIDVWWSNDQQQGGERAAVDSGAGHQGKKQDKRASKIASVRSNKAYEASKLAQPEEVSPVTIIQDTPENSPRLPERADCNKWGNRQAAGQQVGFLLIDQAGAPSTPAHCPATPAVMPVLVQLPEPWQLGRTQAEPTICQGANVILTGQYDNMWRMPAMQCMWQAANESYPVKFAGDSKKTEKVGEEDDSNDEKSKQTRPAAGPTAAQVEQCKLGRSRSEELQDSSSNSSTNDLKAISLSGSLASLETDCEPVMYDLSLKNTFIEWTPVKALRKVKSEGALLSFGMEDEGMIAVA
eukprot:TRINITY_DN43666_c0_g1_i1.p1 TRINITY_DN43666_c0_g1~~TRINITY_DN43666_c0_g1_i1.p1  ORF type:complete len:499 (+),score=110.74 TRINITY_DN43666_c0_g1_i1:102-1499(+)